jgi:hypothetical protein
MKIFVAVKSLIKRKNYIINKELELSVTPRTLRELIIEIVKLNVEEFNNKKTEMNYINYLTEDSIKLQSTTGKIGFNTKYNDKIADIETSINNAIQGFEDGLYKIFINEEEIENLDNEIYLNNGDMVVFIKLTMLAGRMW